MNIKTLLLSLACCSVMSCNTDNVDDEQNIPPTTDFGDRITGLVATISTNAAAPASSSTDDITTVWKIGDGISVTDGVNFGNFDVATGIGTTTGKFNGSFSYEATPLYAVYPTVTSMTGFTAPIVINTVQSDQTVDVNNIKIGVCNDVKPASESLFALKHKAVKASITLDFATAGNTYAAEKVNSIKIIADGVNFAGDCPFDLSNPDAQLTGSASSITYTFSEAPTLADKVSATIMLAPCDLRTAASVHFIISTSGYTFHFSKRPSDAFAENTNVSMPLTLSEFTSTTSVIPAEGEVKITRELPALNLSVRGTANCYIVDKAARCSFNATVMGNGVDGIVPSGNFTDYQGNALSTSASISPASVELLWQTVDGLISEPILSDGIVNFNSSDEKGNALIAAKDKDGKIMWSWHIWCTDSPIDQTYMPNGNGNVYTFMDRNLGATSALDDTNSLGLAYQWGRKDPFPGSSKYYDMTEPTLYGKITAVEKVIPTASTGTIANAIQNPTTFLYAADWLVSGANNNLWGNPQGETVLVTTSKKSLYDPCPVGYKLPGKDAFSIFTKSGANTTDTKDHNVSGTANASTWHGWDLYYGAIGSGTQAWYPYNGCRYYSSGALNRGSYYYYWTSAPSAGTKSCCLAFHKNMTEINPLYTFQRGNGQTTRCVKE